MTHETIEPACEAWSDRNLAVIVSPVPALSDT